MATGESEIHIEFTASFGELRQQLRRKCPNLYEGVFSADGSLRDTVLLFLNQEKVSADELNRLALKDADRLVFVPAIVGG